MTEDQSPRPTRIEIAPEIGKIEKGGKAVMLSIGQAGQVFSGPVTIRPPAPVYTPEPPPAPGVLPAPGALPPGSRLLWGPNALFTGRGGEFEALADSLLRTPDGSAPPAAVVLYGMGGVGKTQLAAEFCCRYGRCFHGAHWISAGASSDLAAEVAECGRNLCAALFPESWPGKLAEQLALTLSLWQAQPARLVVLDNLDDPAVLDEWLPRLAGMHVVITSRRAAWPAHHRLRLIDLNPLPRADSLALLRRTSPRLASAADSLLAALAAALHDLPLALHLAGLHLKLKPRLSADAYLAQLSQLGGALAQSDLPAELAELPTGHGLRLFETFHASWTLLNEQTALDAAARRLFLACGWCAPNLPIPYDVLEEFAQIEARRGGWPDGNDTEIDLPMQRLMAIGLLALTDEAAGPSIHPLLAEFARRLDEQTAAKDGPRALTRITVALIHRGEAALLSRLPADIAPYLPHVLSAVERVGAVYPLGAAVLLNMLGSIFYIRGDYAAARPAFERAIEIYATLPGDRRSQMATTYHNLGLLLRTISDLSGAYHYFEQSLALKGEIEDEQDADMAPTLASIGLLLKEMGDFPAAREYLERALAIYRTVFGEQHAFVAEAYNNLGTLDLALDDLPAAREYFERSLAGSRAAFGEQHPTVATALDNLGGVLHRSGKTAAAREYVEQALAIRRLKLGEQHPYVATSLNNLGVLLGELGEQPAARTHFLQALEILTLTLPPDHPDIIALYENLAKLDEEEEK